MPPPAVLRGPLSLLPPPVLRFGMQRAVDAVLAAPLADGRLTEITGRRLGIAVTDLALHWVVEVQPQRVVVLDTETAEAAVSGAATDLLLLVTRREDADTLFFHRRLQLTGDVELGLLVRNLLDQLPWESLPAPLRVALDAAAGLALAASEDRNPSVTRS